MLKIGGNKIVRSLLLLCVMAQMVAMTPHHHHEGSDAVCLNYFHIDHEHNCSQHANNCCDDHSHSRDPISACTIHQLIITQPEKEGSETEIISVTVPDDCLCGFCDIDQGILLASHAAFLPGNELGVHPFVIPPVMRYIAQALTPRAPDFKA